MKKNYKLIGIISFLVMLVLFLLISYINGGKNELKKNNAESIFVEEDIKENKEIVLDKDISSNEIVVDIKGEVVNPNIYWINEDCIVQDLIDKAGGLTDLADISNINRAEKLKNHQSIVIPNKNDIKEVSIPTNASVEVEKGIININTASESELDSLPGIGVARARDIIKYREEKGGFNNIDELKNVKGIGEKYFEDLKDKVTV